MADHDNFLEGEDETDRSSVSRLPSTRFVFIFFLSVPSTRFRSVHSFCLSCLKSRHLRFRFLSQPTFGFVFPFVFPLHDLVTSRTVPVPCREGMYLTPAREHTTT